MIEPGKKPRGCLFYTGTVILAALVMLIIGSYFGYRYARKVILHYTDTQPAPVPGVTLSEAQIRLLRERIARFGEAVGQGKAAEPLVVTAEEANALIASAPELVTVKGGLHFGIEGSNLTAQVSIAAEDLGLRPLKGRYLNASGTFKVGFTNGVLEVTAQSLSAKGEPLPENLMRHISPQNFAFKLNQDPRAKAALGRLQEIKLQDGTLILVPRR